MAAKLCEMHGILPNSPANSLTKISPSSIVSIPYEQVMTTATHRRFQSAPRWETPSRCVPVEELEVLRAWHPNLLLGGTPQAITAALDELQCVFRPAVVSMTGGTALPLPLVTGAGTLILRDVDLLSGEEQQRLLDWLKQHNASVQVVATTTRRLLDLVESAKFDATLYYALNVVFIPLPS